MEDIQALVRSQAIVPSAQLADPEVPLGELTLSDGLTR